MPTSKNVVIVTSLGIITVLLAIATASVAALTLKRSLTIYQCDKEKEPEIIVKSGPEYILANPGTDWQRNSFLVSSEVPNPPPNWLFYGLTVTASNNQGFSLQATEKRPYIRNITFDARNGTLIKAYGTGPLKPDKIICRPSTELAPLAQVLNNVPLDYLLLRNKLIPFLNPNLGQKDFNLALYSAVRGKEHGTYSTYKLLSALNANDLTGEQKLNMEGAHDELIKSNSTTTSVWEYDGDYTYWWEFENEKPEASRHAGDWCTSQQFESTGDYTTKGYKITSSEAEKMSSDWQKHLYPDGRFSGYVKFKVDCNGRRYQLTKEGSVDEVGLNTWSGRD